MPLEQIEWVSVNERLPDDEITVLMYSPGESEPVWLGWLHNKNWYEYGTRLFSANVTHWAELPIGPI